MFNIIKHFCSINILIYVFVFANYSFAQTNTIQVSKNQNEIDSIVQLFEQKNSLKWLSILPSVNYDALNNSFSIGLSVSNLTNYYQTKQRNKIEKQKLINQLQESYKREKELLDQKKIDFEIEYNSIILDTTTLSISKKLYQITVGKYRNQEITTEQFLKEKLSVLNEYKSILKSCAILERKAKEITEKSNINIYEINIGNLIKSLTQEEKNLRKFENGEFSMQTKKTEPN